jgi:hypothetical protein
MDIDNNIISNMTNLYLNENQIYTSNQIDDEFITNLNSLSLTPSEQNEIQDYYETYYDYDRQDFQKEIVPDNIEDTIEDNIDTFDNSPYVYVCFGIPNIYCSVHFDDEDFIFNRYLIPNDIKKKIKINESINYYLENYCIGNNMIIDYECKSDDPDITYGKILYIYKFIEYYYKDLKHLKPIERIKHLPDTLLYWVENIVNIFKKIINNKTLKETTFETISNIYFKELIYGLNIIINELSLMLNHYKIITLWDMEERHIKLFFKIVNNMCVIIIFIKLNE